MVCLTKKTNEPQYPTVTKCGECGATCKFNENGQWSCPHGCFPRLHDKEEEENEERKTKKRIEKVQKETREILDRNKNKCKECGANKT